MKKNIIKVTLFLCGAILYAAPIKSTAASLVSSNPAANVKLYLGDKLIADATSLNDLTVLLDEVNTINNQLTASNGESFRFSYDEETDKYGYYTLNDEGIEIFHSFKSGSDLDTSVAKNIASTVSSSSGSAVATARASLDGGFTYHVTFIGSTFSDNGYSVNSDTAVNELSCTAPYRIISEQPLVTYDSGGVDYAVNRNYIVTYEINTTEDIDISQSITVSRHGKKVAHAFFVVTKLE